VFKSLSFLAPPDVSGCSAGTLGVRKIEDKITDISQNIQTYFILISHLLYLAVTTTVTILIIIIESNSYLFQCKLKSKEAITRIKKNY
jgi:hypothetical protein